MNEQDFPRPEQQPGGPYGQPGVPPYGPPTGGPGPVYPGRPGVDQPYPGPPAFEQPHPGQPGFEQPYPGDPYAGQPVAGPPGPPPVPPRGPRAGRRPGRRPAGPGGPTRVPRRGRRRAGFAAAICLVLAVTVIAGYASLDALCRVVQRPASSAYTADVNRNAEWIGNPSGRFSTQQIDQLASSNSYVVIEKFHDNWNLQGQFDDARAIKAAAAAEGRQVKVYAYFNSSIWFEPNTDGWGQFSKTFKTSYLLRDADDNLIPYYGLFKSSDNNDDPLGHLLDLSNPQYREWAVNTVASWMKDAPFDGVAFDTANPMIGDNPVRNSIGTGTAETQTQLLCGYDTLTCNRIQEWNDGLSSLLSTATSTLKAMGDTVIFNGVAASDQRVNRNVALLPDTGGASNESFCYTSQLKNASGVDFTPLADDVKMMQSTAESGKQLIEITNYVDDVRLKYGAYCLGGFLMGWQPGSSYWVYHTGYRDDLSENRQLPEVDLNLGTPTGAADMSDGALMTRQFSRGFVAVNSGDSDLTVTLPYDVDQYSDGKVQASYTKGATLTLSGHDAAFFLRTDTSEPQSFTRSACSVF